jgi:hypothetical protein
LSRFPTIPGKGAAMNLFKPKRTFESVVGELIAGLEDGSIVLGKEKEKSRLENQSGALRGQAEQLPPHSTPQPGRLSQS